MKCPDCKVVVYGLDCPKCGREFPPECPDCKTVFTRADHFCRNCGRDLFFVNFSNKVNLRFPINVLPEAYEYPAGQAGLKVLKNTGPLRELTRLFIREFSEPVFHGQLLGTAVKVTERQFPRIQRIASVCERILTLPPINIFVGQTPPKMSLFTSFTYGTEESACIFLSALLVDSMNDDELRFVIGREMGHIKCRHVLYLTIAQMVTMGISIFETIGGQVVAPILNQILAPWQRKAEMTADRAGLVCCQSINISIRTLVKVALGAAGLAAQLNLEEYIKQAEMLEKKYRWSQPREAHPYLIHRVHHLRDFYDSSQYRQIFQSAFDPACPKILCVPCKTHEYLTDRSRPLSQVACPKCHARLQVMALFCPHCHLSVPIADATSSLATFQCPECHKGYFEGLSGLHEGPPESFYDVLGVHDSASEQDIERAFVCVVKPTLREEIERTGQRPTSEAVVRKVKAQGAYRVLSERKSREDYNTRLALMRELHRKKEELGLAAPPERLPTCASCSAPLYGKVCTQCGTKLEEPQAAAPDAAPPSEQTGEAPSDQARTGESG